MAMQGSGAGAAPPGWYPDPEGRVRWWDGTRWGPLQPAGGPAGGGSDSRTTAMLAHLLAIFTGFLGPLVIYLLNGEKDPFVRHHAAEALNFQLTMLIAWFATILLMFVLVGLLVAPVLFVVALVFEIQGTMAANRGEWWVYPINIRMVPGARGV